MACHFSLSLSHSAGHFCLLGGFPLHQCNRALGNRHGAASISPSLHPGRIARPSYVYAKPTANTRVYVPEHGFDERQL